MRYSLVTIAAMMAIGFMTRYSGLDATLGLAFAQTGVLYPFFGTMLGWLGVALTGSDTSSNVLFGSLQKITAEQLGLSPTLMAAANSSGGVMGKMIDAQSIVVASTATRWYGHEGEILRYVFFHSLALAALGGRAGDAAGLRLAVHRTRGEVGDPEGGVGGVPFSVRTGAAGRAGSGGRVSRAFITSATARSSCGSRPASTDFGSFSTTMSGSTPWPSMIHSPLAVGDSRTRAR